MGERKSALFFEGIAVPGNGANYVSIKPLLKKASPQKLFCFFSESLHACKKNVNRGAFCAWCLILRRRDIFAFSAGFLTWCFVSLRTAARNIKRKICQSLHSTTEKKVNHLGIGILLISTICKTLLWQACSRYHCFPFSFSIVNREKWLWSPGNFTLGARVFFSFFTVSRSQIVNFKQKKKKRNKPSGTKGKVDLPICEPLTNSVFSAKKKKKPLAPRVGNLRRSNPENANMLECLRSCTISMHCCVLCTIKAKNC